MTNLGEGTGFVAGGTTAGAGISATIGKMGLVGKFGGISIGMIPVAVVGGVTGAAAYGALKAIEESDATAIGAIGLGTVGGLGVSTVVGGMGLGLGGSAIAIGMLPISVAGGVVGLGIYGLAKMFKNNDIEKNIYKNLLFLEQITQDYEEEKFWSSLEIEEELKILKEKVGFKTNSEQKEFLVMLFLPMADDKQESKAKTQYIQSEIEELLSELKDRIDQNLKEDNKTHTQTFQDEIGNFWQALQSQKPKPNFSIEDLTTTNQKTFSCQCGYILQDHNATVNAIAISPDGQSLISGSNDRTVKLWNLRTGQPIYTFLGLGGEVQTVAFSPDGKRVIAAGFDQRISAWELPSKQLFCAFFSRNCHHSHEGAIFSVTFTRDRKYLISASGDHTIRIWGGFTAQLKRTLNGHSDIVWSLAITPDDQILVSGSADKTIGIWELGSYQSPRFLKGHSGEVTAVTISKDGKFMISGSTDATVKLWHLSTGELIKTLTGHTATVLSLAISPDGENLASASSKEIKLWSLSTKELLQNLPGCSPIIFSPDGKFLISGGYGSYIKVWYVTFGVIAEQIISDFVESGEWWEVLKVSENAAVKEVKEAYRNLARQYHPDLNADEQAIAKMQIINRAYEQFFQSEYQNR